jgi:hypothetical protein
VAQQSYSPYLAASHLFLADRYPGEYNKNSELLQGFLTDPTAFGGSQPLLDAHAAHGLLRHGRRELECRAPTIASPTRICA